MLRFLRWSDVDPSTHAFDATRTRAIAERAIASAHGDDRARLAESIDRALAADHGVWATGWSWSVGEGGPVRAWCCATHSLLRKGETREASVERVVSAVAEWHGWLVTLATLFSQLQLETADLPIEEGVERAAARLLPLILERTGYEDAWYATFERAVSWYLDASGHDPSARLVHDVVSGHFASWVVPSTDAAQRACTEIGLSVAIAATGTRSPPDALAAWRIARSKAFTNAPASRVREPVLHDAHERWIRASDRARDPVRAERMLAALAACRASAKRHEPLTLERMLAWQSVVLGETAALRATDAFAKAGRKRYGHDPELGGRFARAIEEANDAQPSVCVRAARAYLDTCFYHPFVDGNARAARLALDFVLTGQGLALHAVEPLFVVARDASDWQGAWAMALVLEQLVGPRVG